jgi:hypothetical protein
MPIVLTFTWGLVFSFHHFKMDLNLGAVGRRTLVARGRRGAWVAALYVGMSSEDVGQAERGDKREVEPI